MSAAEIRFDINCAPPTDFGKRPPVVTIQGYPPLKDEGSRDYYRRVEAQIMQELFEPKPSLAARVAGWLFGRGK